MRPLASPRAWARYASSPRSRHGSRPRAGSSMSKHCLELTSPHAQAAALDLRTGPGSVSLGWNGSEALSLLLSSEKDEGGWLVS